MPGASRSSSSHLRFTLRGAGLGVAGIVLLVAAAWTGRVDLLVSGLALALMPVAAAVLLTFDRPLITIVRTLASRVVVAGERVEVTITVRNEGVRATPTMRWRDLCTASLGTTGFEALPPLASRQSGGRPAAEIRLRYATTTTRRDIADLGPLLLERTDPFGLVCRTFTAGAATRVTVVPPVESLEPTALDLALREGREQETVRHGIPNAEELAAREYRAGDALRRVHWRATARHDTLMVRQEEPSSTPEAWLVLDTARPGSKDADGPASASVAFEAAVALAASLGTHLLARGYLLGVAETAPAQLVSRATMPGTASHGAPIAAFEPSGGARELLVALAGVTRMRPGRTDPAAALGAALRRTPHAAPVFVISAGGAGVEALAPLRALCRPAIVFDFDASPTGCAFERAGWAYIALSPAGSASAAGQRAGAR